VGAGRWTAAIRCSNVAAHRRCQRSTKSRARVGWFPRERAIEVIEEVQGRHRDSGDEALDDAEEAGDGGGGEDG
jgi:hypothetical protein